VGLFSLFRVQRRLEQLLGRGVDLVMRDAVRPQLRELIVGEAVRASWPCRTHPAWRCPA